jgi:hypothetical protein
MSVLSGGCACGAVRYDCSAPALFCLNCHCRDCQRESGSAFVPVMAVKREAFEVVRGSPRHFVLTADSGHTTTRAFCGDCGSPLFGLPGAAPELVMIRAGSLDEPGSFAPSQDIFIASAQPWDFMNPELPKAPRHPDSPAS